MRYTECGNSGVALSPSQLPLIPNGGSVNQIESSDLQTMSLGEFSRLPLNLSASTVIVPSYSVRVTLRVRCSQTSSRPWRSRVMPFELFAGWRNTPKVPVASSYRMIRLLGMSLTSR